MRIVFPVVDYASSQCGGLVGRATGVPRADVAMGAPSAQAVFFNGYAAGTEPSGCHMVVYGSMHCLPVARARYACRPTNPNPKMNLDTSE